MPTTLAEDLVDNFLQIRHDTATQTLGRAAPGKFVETVVQILQYRATGTYDAVPNVDAFLRNGVEKHTTLDDGLRICAARLNRAIYALRSKRGIAHKGTVDPNIYDLQLIHSACQWTISELLRLTSGLQMQDAGALIQLIHAPLGPLVEDIDGRRIIHGDFSVREEILILLRSHYPQRTPIASILQSLNRRKPTTVRARVTELYRAKLVEGSGDSGYVLTTPGFVAATEIIRNSVG